MKKLFNVVFFALHSNSVFIRKIKNYTKGSLTLK